jgi:hypothetical protein
VSYVYDGDDQRVKEAYSTTERYSAGPHMELQVSGSTKIFRSYYRLGDKLLGMRVYGQNAPTAEVGVSLIYSCLMPPKPGNKPFSEIKV